MFSSVRQAPDERTIFNRHIPPTFMDTPCVKRFSIGCEREYRKIDLGRTFRSVDRIALSARRFVLQNPSQIKKTVITAASADGPSIRISYYERGCDEGALREALTQVTNTKSGKGCGKGCGKASVLLLGRYHHLKPKTLDRIASDYGHLSMRFLTVHASKGLEADHVVILRAAADRMGFPSGIVDDPLLDLVLPEPENHSHAEERRLFYVALTRARKSVTVLADRQKPSGFVRELLGDPEYETTELGEPGIAEHRCGKCGGRMLSQRSKKGRRYFSCEHGYLCGEMLRPCNVCGKGLPVNDPKLPDSMTCRCGASFPTCPACPDGWLVERPGRHGKFLGCIKYPDCKGTKKIERQQGRRARG